MPKPEDNALSRAEQAYQKLLDEIREGTLKPGSRIREVEVAERLEMSRTPVREALRRLESDGLLTVAPYRGMLISKLGYQEVMELYQMREVLEATASGLAAQHASEAEIYAIRGILAQWDIHADAKIQARQNKIFHNAIYHAAHNRYLLKSLNGLRDALTLLGKTTFALEGRGAEALKEHTAIVDAIEKRDVKAAETAATVHIQAAQRARMNLLGEELAEQDTL